MINWQVILLGAISFILALCAHILCWRLSRPKKQIQSLLLIFAAVPIVAHVLCLSRFPIYDLLLSLVMTYSLSISYILFYPAAQAISPTLKIELIVKRFMPAGISQEQLKKYFPQDELFCERLDDLLDEGFLTMSESGLKITAKGRYFLKVFTALRGLLGLGIGQG